MSLVEVRPIEKETWHGKKGDENFAQPQVIEVLYDVNTGKYATGLSEKEAKDLGKKLGLDLSDTFNPNEPHPYWSTKAAWITLPNNTTLLDPNKPMELIKIKNLRASDYVANSLKEYEEGLAPQATHYIYDEEEKVTKEASKVNKRKKAYLILDKLSKDEKINLIHILSNRGVSVRERSDSFIDGQIGEILEDNLDEFLRYAQMDKDETFTRSLVLEAYYKGVLIKEGTAYNYMGDRIGNNLQETVRYLLDPKNQQLKVVILEKLNS